MMSGRVFAEVLAAVSCQSAGQAMQKLGVTAAAPRFPARCSLRCVPVLLGALARSWWWVGGVTLGVVGAAFALEALASGELVMVVPLLGLTVVVTALIGVVGFGERLAAIEALGAGVALVGATLLAAEMYPAAPDAVDPWLPSRLWTARAMGIAFVLAGGGRDRLTPEIAAALGAGIMFGTGNLLVKLAAGAVGMRCGSFRLTDGSCAVALLIEPLAYGLLAAELVGFLLLQAAYSAGRLTVVGAFKTAASVSTSAMLGSAVLGESIDGRRAVALLTVVAGIGLLGAGPSGQRWQGRAAA